MHFGVCLGVHGVSALRKRSCCRSSWPQGPSRGRGCQSEGRTGVFVQTAFLIYDPPFYTDDRKDRGLVDPVGK